MTLSMDRRETALRSPVKPLLYGRVDEELTDDAAQQ
jgi:hypothetical protein